jgi:hypothetical protein
MAIQRPYVHGSSHRSVESFFLWRGHVSAGVYATAASTLCWSCPADARSDAATISALPNVGKFPPIMKCDPVFDLKTICRFDAATMSMDRAILLISDRPDRSQELARRLGGLCACRTTGLYERESTPELVTAGQLFNYRVGDAKHIWPESETPS